MVKTPVPRLDSFFDPPQDGMVGIFSTDLSPGEARAFLDTSFERQRLADPKHIGTLADMMQNSEWLPGEQLTFVVENDKPILVDGQHRLRAAIEANWTGLWCIRVIHSESPQGAYVLLDTNQKKRPPSVIGEALGFEGLSPKAQQNVIAAAKYQNDWRRGQDYELPKLCSVPPVRDNVARARERLPQFQQADLIIQRNGNPRVRQTLRTSKIFAVLAEVLVNGGEEAVYYVTEVAGSGGGIAQEVREELREKSPKRKAAGQKSLSSYFAPRVAAMGWNQRDKSSLSWNYKDPLPVSGTSLIIPA